MRSVNGRHPGHTIQYVGFGYDEYIRLRLINTSFEKLLAEYFEIDLDKVEDERRAMLDGLRNASG